MLYLHFQCRNRWHTITLSLIAQNTAIPTELLREWFRYYQRMPYRSMGATVVTTYAIIIK